MSDDGRQQRRRTTMRFAGIRSGVPRFAGVLAAIGLASGAVLPVAISSPAGASSALAVSPPAVATGDVTNVRPNSVVVTGTINPHGAATTWYFEYGPNTTLVSTTPVRSAGSGTAAVTVAQMITGLASATSYDYRLVATNNAGTTFGASGLFNTSAAPVVSTGAASNIAAHSGTLSGIVNPEALATNWYFQYGLTTGYGSRTATMHLVASPNATTVSTAVAGLRASSTYHFRIVAMSSAGTSLGTDATFNTGLEVTINASATSLVYGGSTNLYGTVANGVKGDAVAIEAEPFNESAFSPVATVVTGGGGAWSFTASPSVRTTYEARWNGATSSPVILSVSPQVALSKASAGRLATRVAAATSFARHVLQLQILTHGLWVTWKHVRLNRSGAATFATRIPAGVGTVRMAIGPFVLGIDQAGPGYLAGYSRPISYGRA